MGVFTKWILVFFTSPFGVVVLAALDSTIFFTLPLGIDAAVVVMATRQPSLVWLVPLLATCGSLAGAALTFWMGRKAGDEGLERFVPANRLEKIRQRVRRSGAFTLAALDLVPPPFPFSLFVLAAGALEVSVSKFFVTLAVCRLIRFGGEALLAWYFGPRILTWLDSSVLHDVVVVIIIAAVGLSAFSIYKLTRPVRPLRT